ncbi:hypothetical protein MHU86_20302 [Fragilaria crotonensis]|nr:hypothetical protein MHU86_20302 [Fragilaria crotonensis]
MSTAIPLIPPTDSIGKIDILLSRWRDNSRLCGLLTMIRDDVFVMNKPRYILESMKVEGWRFVEKRAGSGKLIPIDDESVLVSTISDMLNERDLSSFNETNALPVGSTNTRDDFHSNMKGDPCESVSTRSEQGKSTPHATNFQYSVTGPCTRTSNAAKKMDIRGALNESLDRTSRVASRETNAKRSHKRRNSIILPPQRPQNALSSVTVTVNVIPTDDPTIEEVHRIVLANAIALKTQEELQELRNAATTPCNQRFFDDKNVAPRATISGIFKDDSRHDPMHTSSVAIATWDLQSPCRINLPSRPNLNYKILQRKRLIADVPPLMQDSLQEEVGDGASTKRPFLQVDQCMSPRELVSVVSPCNEKANLEMVDLNDTSIHIDSTFFTATESVSPEFKTLQAKPSGRNPLKLAMRKESCVVSTKREASAGDDIEGNSDQKESMQTSCKRVKRLDQSDHEAHKQSFEAEKCYGGESLNYQSCSQSAVTAPFAIGDASSAMPQTVGNLVCMPPTGLANVLDGMHLPAVPFQACDVLFCETYDGRRNNISGNVMFMTFLLGMSREFGRCDGNMDAVASHVTACFVLNNPTVRFLVPYGTSRDGATTTVWHQLSFSEVVRVTTLILARICE